MWEKLGTVLLLAGFVIVGIMTMSAYRPVAEGSTYYMAYVLGQDAGILQGIGWIVVGLGSLLRFYPRGRT